MSRNNKDPQQQALYDWETSFLNAYRHEMLDLDFQLPYDVARRFVKKICAAYGVPAPKVLRHRSRSHHTAYYSHVRKAIVLPEGWATTAMVIAHETAHYLVYALFTHSSNIESHGAHFCRIFQNLLSRFLEVDTVKVERSMLQARLKLVSMSPVRFS